MAKVVLNRCWGGFGLSNKAEAWLKEKGVENPEGLPRHDPLLVEAVETLGEEAGDEYATLVVVEVDTNLYSIEEYDGYETLRTPETMHWIKIS